MVETTLNFVSSTRIVSGCFAFGVEPPLPVRSTVAPDWVDGASSVAPAAPTPVTTNDAASAVAAAIVARACLMDPPDKQVTGSESMGGNDRERPPVHRLTPTDSSTTTPRYARRHRISIDLTSPFGLGRFYPTIWCNSDGE